MGVAFTVVQLMDQIERQPRDRVVLESAGRHLTLAQLRECSNRLANALIGHGLRPGDRVAYAAANTLEYFVLEFALLKAGLVKVPLNPRMTGLDLVHCLELADVRLVVADAWCAGALDEAGGPGDGTARVVIGTREGWESFDDLVRRGADSRPRTVVCADDLYHIRFSSGSTGKPKGIAISQSAARAAIMGNTWVMSTSAPVAKPRTLQVAPLVYAGGWSVLPTLLRGGTNVVLPTFDADETLRAIRDEGIDWMFAVPTMLRRMSQSPELPALKTARLGCMMLAGEPAALPALETVSQYTDALVQCWGQTEAPASTTFLSREEMKDPGLWPSIGRAIPGVDFSLLVDGEVLGELAPGVQGELVIRTPTIASALLGAEQERAARLLDDGWWRTSDLGRFDEEGRIYLVGRASETIITGGTNVQPVEIERAIEAQADVVEAVVVGVPDAQWGETPAALVYAPGLAPGQGGRILSWVHERLAGYKRPRHVFLSAAPLPRASGESKIARGELKRMLAGWVDGSLVLPDGIVKVRDSDG